MIRYKICWSAFTNISFRGETDVMEWTDDDGDSNDLENYIYNGDCNLEGLSIALEASGFEWWMEMIEEVIE